MKKILAFVLTLGLIGGAVFLSYRQSKTAPEEPASVVWRMLDQSRAGSVEGYLDCFAGQTRAQLEATAQEMTWPRFADYIKESVGKVKGVAVYDVENSGEAAATLVVEYVYQDKNERQRMNLRMEQGIWRIEFAEASQRIQPVIPYGKPVTEVQ